MNAEMGNYDGMMTYKQFVTFKEHEKYKMTEKENDFLRVRNRAMEELIDNLKLEIKELKSEKRNLLNEMDECQQRVHELESLLYNASGRRG
jgi:chromosome segregation ATPase